MYFNDALVGFMYSFLISVNFDILRDLVQLLGGAIAGIHSMTDEHFGISVVEFMAAGAIPIGRHLLSLEQESSNSLWFILKLFMCTDLPRFSSLLLQLIILLAQRWTLFWKKMEWKPDFLPALWMNMQMLSSVSLKCQRPRGSRWLQRPGIELADFRNRDFMKISKLLFDQF